MAEPLLQDHSLVWGVLSFAGPSESESTFDIEAMSGTSYGNPQPVIEVVRSLLIDGALAAVTGWDNREVPIRLRISANDGESSAAAEAALVQQVLMDQPYPLVWTPPLDQAAATVFDTVVARLDRDTDEGWDLKEKLHGYRYYLLTLTCLPFARAVEATVVEALGAPPASPTTVNIDACNSTTNWTRQASDPGATGPTVVSGAIEAEGIINSPSSYLRLVRTNAVAMGATPYLEVKVTLDTHPAFGGSWKIQIDGDVHNPISTVRTAALAWTLYFDLAGESFTTLKIYFDYGSSELAQFTMSVSNIARTDTLASATPRQQSRLVTVPGSTPTQAQVRVYDAAPAELGGDILVYTSRNETRPDLRQWLDSSGADVAAASAISGVYNALSTDMVFLIPANLLTAGSYALVANVVADADVTVTWEAQMATLGGATNVPGSAVITSGETVVAETAALTLEVRSIAALVLPVVEVEGANYAVKLTLSGTADIGLDEAWLFSLDDGALTWVKDTEELTWIEVRSPELGAARPSVWGGRNAVGTGASCIDWKCESFGSHRFEPGTMQIFTVTTTSEESQAEMELFPRFHSHVWGGETT